MTSTSNALTRSMRLHDAFENEMKKSTMSASPVNNRLRLHLIAAVLHNNLGARLHAQHQIAGAMKHYRKSFQFRTKYNRYSQSSDPVNNNSGDQTSLKNISEMERYIEHLRNELIEAKGRAYSKPDQRARDAFRRLRTKSKPKHFSICVFSDPIIIDAEKYVTDLLTSDAKLDKVGAAHTLFNMALLHQERGNSTPAVRLLHMALDSISSKSNEKPSIRELRCMIHNNIGNTLFQEMKYTTAMDSFSRAFDSGSELTRSEQCSSEGEKCDKRTVGYIQLNMAWASTKTKSFDDAEHLCQDAYDMFHQAKHESSQPEDGHCFVDVIMKLVKRKRAQSILKLISNTAVSTE